MKRNDSGRAGRVASRAVAVVLVLAASPVTALGQSTQPTPTQGATLTGQFGDWGTYVAAPDGGRICFALSRPVASNGPGQAPRDDAYAFVSTRPAERVVNEVSFMTGHRQKKGGHATVTIDGRRFAMYTRDDRAWVKDEKLEPQFVDAMRKGSGMRIESTSLQGISAIDVYSLQGFSLALEKVAQACR